MKRFILSLLVAAVTLVTSSSAFAGPTERNIPVKKVESITIKGSGNVVYVQGNTTSVVVKGASELVDLVEVSNNGNELIVTHNEDFSKKVNSFFKNLKNGFRDKLEPVIYVTSPDLIEVNLAGSGDFKSYGKVDTDNLEISLRGSGDIDFADIICDNIHATLLGSGDIELKKVEAVNAYYELKGSGDMEVKQQRVRKTDVSLFGSGDIEVDCRKCQVVNANVVGSGNIELKGEISELNKNSRGSGSITHKR